MRRFEREVPNDLGQIDATQVALADSSKAWIIDVRDDHARYAIAAKGTRRAEYHGGLGCMEEAIRAHGAPRQAISDSR